MKGYPKVSVSKLGSLKKGGAILREKLRPDGAAVCLYGDIYTKYAEVVTSFISRVEPSAVADGVRINNGDVVFAGSGETAEEIGKCIAYVGNEEAYAGGDVVILSSHGQDARYLGYVLNAEDAVRQKMRLGQGSSVMHLYKDDVGSIKIPLPPLAEQRKIAEILRTWDEAIETAEAELRAKQERKRVLMQGLFSKKDCGESFEGRYITEIAELSKDRPRGNETVCVDLEHVSPSAGQLIGSLPVNGDEVSKLRFRKDDVLFAKLRPYLKKAWLSDREGICSSEFWVFRAKQDLGDPAFLRQFVLSEPFLEACAASSGSKMPRADWAHVEKIKFMLPSLNEQRVTAGILQAADAEIDAINDFIKLLSTQKRGLMQKLLTGEVRVAA